MRSLVVAAALTAIVVAAFAATGAAAGRTPRGGDAKKPAVIGCSQAYFDGNKLLGPVAYPTKGSLGAILRGWDRLDGLTAPAYLAKYTNAMGYIYPPDDGFLIVNGKPREHRGTLKVGEQVDRFGTEGGMFLAPAGTPYAKRSIPPTNLDYYANSPACNYYRYRVTKAFAVEEGPIAPAFGQPGLGEQFVLRQDSVPRPPYTQVTVSWLIQKCYLAREVPVSPPYSLCANSGARPNSRARPRSRR